MLAPSGSSSRFTLVMTACSRPICFAASATRCGSSRSSSCGLPVRTAQKPQERVQTLPRIMNVAVRLFQHSPMFGQRASSHTVWRFRPRIVSLMSRYTSPPGTRALSHSGRPCAPGAPFLCCRNGRYSVGMPSGGGATERSSQRWRTSKVRVPFSRTLRLICLRATVLLSSTPSALYYRTERGADRMFSHRDPDRRRAEFGTE